MLGLSFAVPKVNIYILGEGSDSHCSNAMDRACVSADLIGCHGGKAGSLGASCHTQGVALSHTHIRGLHSQETAKEDILKR